MKKSKKITSLSGQREFAYDQVLYLMNRKERFQATVYAMNTLLQLKGIYSPTEFEQRFMEWVGKTQMTDKPNQTEALCECGHVRSQHTENQDHECLTETGYEQICECDGFRLASPVHESQTRRCPKCRSTAIQPAASKPFISPEEFKYKIWNPAWEERPIKERFLNQGWKSICNFTLAYAQAALAHRGKK